MAGMYWRDPRTRLFALGGAAGPGRFEFAVALLPDVDVPARQLYSSTNVPTTRRASARLSGVFGRTASDFSEPCQRSILPFDCG